MSGLIKNALNLSFLRSAGCHFSKKATFKLPANQLLCRSLWHLSSQRIEIPRINNGWSCDCHSKSIHTKGSCVLSKAASQKIDQLTQGEKELAEFLTEEIAAEKDLYRGKETKEVYGFKVKTDGPEVTLIKESNDETISIKFNVNHSVGEETDYDSAETDPTKDEHKPIVNRPPFDVEINKNGKILGFRCTMVAQPSKDSPREEEEGYNDLFTIDEVVMCKDEWTDSDYHVPGEIMDGTLYDLLMNLLEDKGINNEFIQQLTNFSTSYEHTLYINLLEQMKKFVASSK